MKDVSTKWADGDVDDSREVESDSCRIAAVGPGGVAGDAVDCAGDDSMLRAEDDWLRSMGSRFGLVTIVCVCPAKIAKSSFRESEGRKMSFAPPFGLVSK